MQKIMVQAHTSDARLIGLTDNHEFKYHFQSYFLVAKNEGVGLLADFWRRSFAGQQEGSHMAYELQLLDAFEAKGTTRTALFQSAGCNRTMKEWRELIEEGFPL